MLPEGQTDSVGLQLERQYHLPPAPPQVQCHQVLQMADLDLHVAHPPNVDQYCRRSTQGNLQKHPNTLTHKHVIKISMYVYMVIIMHKSFKTELFLNNLNTFPEGVKSTC